MVLYTLNAVTAKRSRGLRSIKQYESPQADGDPMKKSHILLELMAAVGEIHSPSPTGCR